jgi:nicotinate-nucleotide adenylyltransferase
MGTGRLGRSVSQWIAPEDRRVGILGGTFDPVHYGHLVIAEEVREALQLDRVLFVPAARPPHKMDLDISPAADRAEMVKLAIAGNFAFSVCPIELERDGPSYTVDTLEALTDEAHRDGAARSFFFILSSEAASALPNWRSPARILELAQLAVVRRLGFSGPDPGVLSELAGGSPDRVLTVETLPLAHSASDIRSRAASGRSIRYLVPPAVESYIRDHRLYLSTNQLRNA